MASFISFQLEEKNILLMSFIRTARRLAASLFTGRLGVK
jgi:hypothetical protein